MDTFGTSPVVGRGRLGERLLTENVFGDQEVAGHALQISFACGFS